jgi:hypothetical protein
MQSGKFRSRRKMGFIAAIVIALISAYYLFHFMIIGEQPRMQGRGLLIGDFLVQLSGVLIFVIFTAMAILTAYGDREMWKAWAALFGGPAIGVLFSLLSLSEWRVGVVIYTTRLVLVIYSAVAFWNSARGSHR